MSDQTISDLANQYQQLRNANGSEADYEQKYNVLKALGDQLGLPGTPAADILSRLGKPDELTPSLQQSATIQTMPGPAIPSGGVSAEGSLQAYYFVYYLRPKQDYLYFKIDPVQETVIASDWQKST